MVLLSVIVPIYNTEPELLERCFCSLENIGIETYEVLLVDDGSEAYVKQICAKYARKDQRFKYYRKKNGGVSSARNLGIEKALGSYITFVDSDDEIIAGSITVTDFSSQADLIFFNRTLYKDKEQKIRKEIEGENRWVPVEDVFESMITKNRFHGPVGRMYKRSVLQEAGLCFDTGMIQGEDAVFNINVLKRCRSIYYIDKSVYGYHMAQATLRSRWKRDPQKMLSNFQYLYAEKTGLLQLFDGEKRKALSGQLNSNTEYLLFQSCLDMIRVRVFNGDLREACYRFSKSISSDGKLNVKAKTASFFIENKLWGLMGLIGSIRERYLSKIKRTWK